MKSKPLILFTQLFLVIIIAGCGRKDETVFNCSKWDIGKRLTYFVELSDANLIGDSITNIKVNFYKADLEFIELGEKHNTIKWHIRQPVKKPDSLITELNRAVADTLDYQEVLQIIYQTNKLGQYEEIKNWPEVEKYFETVWNKKFEDFTSDPAKKETLTKLKKTFASRPAIEAKLTRDIMALHIIFNTDHTIIETKFKGEVAGLNNQPLILSSISKILEETENNRIVEIINGYDPHQNKEQVDAFITGFSTDTLLSPVRMTDTIQVNYNKLTSLPKQVEYWRYISIDNRKKQIGVLINQIED
jgi:hypothetical protein